MVRKINILALTALLVSASSAGASEIVHQFNSPAFSGIGYTQHVLSVYNQEQAAKQKIKDETKATIRCIPLDQVQEAGTCVYSGKPSTGRVLFAKAY